MLRCTTHPHTRRGGLAVMEADIFVCLHVCGKVVGGWGKGDYAHLFFPVYLLVWAYRRPEVCCFFCIKTDIASGLCIPQDVNYDRTESDHQKE